MENRKIETLDEKLGKVSGGKGARVRTGWSVSREWHITKWVEKKNT